MVKDWKTTAIGLLLIVGAIVAGCTNAVDKAMVGLLVTTGIGFIATADSKGGQQ
jgi:hypothetical protein